MSSTITSESTAAEYVEDKSGRSSVDDLTEAARCDAGNKREEAIVPEYSTWSRGHDVAFIISVCLAQFLSLATLAQTVAPMLTIRDSLKIQSPGQLAWLTAAYSMTLGTFILPSGHLGDVFGPKRIYILGWLWLALWSFITGFAHKWGPIAFSIARGFQGIGPAILVPNAMALIGRTYPVGNKRALVFSIFGAMSPTGFLTGAGFASIFAEFLWWPWSFWTIGIGSLFITFFVYCVVPESVADTPKRLGPQDVSRKFDSLGCISGVSGLILINFALNQAPIVGWAVPYVPVLLVLGGIITSGFFYVELYVAKNPLFPARGLQPQALLTLACIAAGYASHGIWCYYLYLFEEQIRHKSPLLTTAGLIPVAPVGIAFALSTTFLIKKIHVSRVMFIAMICFCLGTVLLASAPEHQTYWGQTFLSILVAPGGMNLSFPAATILLSSAMPRQYQGKAASLVGTVVNYSIASGLGFAGSVERNTNADGASLLKGYRSALYLAIGFSGAGVLISIYFLWSLKRSGTT